MKELWQDWVMFNKGYVDNYNREFPAVVDNDIVMMCKKYKTFMTCPLLVYNGKSIEAKSRKFRTKKAVMEFILKNDNIIPYTTYVSPLEVDGKIVEVYTFRYADIPC